MSPVALRAALILVAAPLLTACASEKSIYARAVDEQSAFCARLQNAARDDIAKRDDVAKCHDRLDALRELARFEADQIDLMRPPLVPPRDVERDTVDLNAASAAVSLSRR